LSGFLLDTNVISELAKGPRSNPHVVAWALAADEMTFFLSVLTMGEIRKGIEKVASVSRKAELEAFIAATVERFSGRIMPFDAATADRWGRLVGRCELNGVKPPPAIDSMIAAIAIEHGFTLVTRNVSDFQFAEVALLNPWLG
jgi:predicted nucleic acid-binding protein